MSIAVLGAGAFGTALAIALAQNGPVTLWARDVSWFGADRMNPRLPDIPVPLNISVTGDLEIALDEATLLFAVPMQSLASLCDQILGALTGKALVACCKGIDLEKLHGPAHLLQDRWPEATQLMLTGPSFADDIARGLPTALTLACADARMGAVIQEQLSTPTLRVYRTTDVTGAELGGALKNVIAIACGAAIGAGLGESARAALMTRGFAEMVRFATHLGALPETLGGLSGLGDLALTCGSAKSRNFRYGQALGEGLVFDPSVTVEGAATAKALKSIADAQGLTLPVCSAVADLTTGRLTVADAMTQLLNRPLKEEHPC